jgi:hypothetical protein
MQTSSFEEWIASGAARTASVPLAAAREFEWVIDAQPLLSAAVAYLVGQTGMATPIPFKIKADGALGDRKNLSWKIQALQLRLR